MRNDTETNVSSNEKKSEEYYTNEYIWTILRTLEVTDSALNEPDTKSDHSKE